MIERSLLIAQAGLTRLRLSLSPPDVLLRPAVGHIGFVEFHRAMECFAAGRQAVTAAEADLARLFPAAALAAGLTNPEEKLMTLPAEASPRA